MPSPLSSFLLNRSLHPSTPTRPTRANAYQHINITTLDTPTHDLRNEILIGFQPGPPHFLVTLSRPTDDTAGCEIGLWEFHPLRRVKLARRLRVEEDGAGYLPVALVGTGYCVVRDAYYQLLYRTGGSGGEACIEVRCLPLEPGKGGWTVWESVTEEDNVFGGMDWSLTSGSPDGKAGNLVVASATRVYFFCMDDEECLENIGGEKGCWTRGNCCIIFEVDVFLEQARIRKNFVNVVYDTRLLPSQENGISICLVVGIVDKRSYQRFKLNVNPRERKTEISSVGEPMALGPNMDAKMVRTLLNPFHGGGCALAQGRSLLNNVTETFTVFQEWYPGGERGSVRELVWEYGGIVIDGWDT
jgi:hypothetical protein